MGNHNQNYAKWIYKNKQLLLDELGCEICGRMSGVIFDRHHIVFKSERYKHPEIDNPLNIIQVCRDCHNGFHNKSISRLELIEERGLRTLFGDNRLS